MAIQDVNKRDTGRTLSAIHAGLAEMIEQWTQGKEDCATPIASLSFFRREVPTEPCACTVEPSVLFVVQGVKQLLVGEHPFAYDTERFLLNSLDIPASSQVLNASPEQPCLGFMLRLDLRMMADIIAQNGMPPPRDRIGDGCTALGAVTHVLLEPFERLLALLHEPDVIPIMAPLIEREIHFRLLTSELAGRLWQIASVGSQSHRIARAIDWLRIHYSRPFRIEELAGHVQMSPSTLHHHFRLLTTMSPLQYQKWLRLNEARRLMLNENLDAANAAFNVGYESPSQFSREYGRLFGVSPKRDIDALRGRGMK